MATSRAAQRARRHCEFHGPIFWNGWPLDTKIAYAQCPSMKSDLAPFSANAVVCRAALQVRLLLHELLTCNGTAAAFLGAHLHLRVSLQPLAALGA